MNIDKMKKVFDNFLEEYKKIEMGYISSNKINKNSVNKLKSMCKDMIDKRIIAAHNFDFSSDKEFLESVKKFVNTF